MTVDKNQDNFLKSNLIKLNKSNIVVVVKLWREMENFPLISYARAFNFLLLSIEAIFLLLKIQ